MEKTKITFSVSTTNSQAKLGFETWLDDQKIVDIDHVQESTEISIPVPNQDAEHVLKLVLKGKCADHTTVDSDGEIVSDAMLTIADLAFDGIKLGQIVCNQATYAHDFNGSGEPVENHFFGNMGCNGTVSLKFSTPIYIWLLENM
jgi:hypothetical protein